MPTRNLPDDPMGFTPDENRDIPNILPDRETELLFSDDDPTLRYLAYVLLAGGTFGGYTALKHFAPQQLRRAREWLQQQNPELIQKVRESFLGRGFDRVRQKLPEGWIPGFEQSALGRLKTGDLDILHDLDILLKEGRHANAIGLLDQGAVQSAILERYQRNIPQLKGGWRSLTLGDIWAHPNFFGSQLTHGLDRWTHGAEALTKLQRVTGLSEDALRGLTVGENLWFRGGAKGPEFMSTRIFSPRLQGLRISRALQQMSIPGFFNPLAHLIPPQAFERAPMMARLSTADVQALIGRGAALEEFSERMMRAGREVEEKYAGVFVGGKEGRGAVFYRPLGGEVRRIEGVKPTTSIGMMKADIMARGASEIWYRPGEEIAEELFGPAAGRTTAQNLRAAAFMKAHKLGYGRGYAEYMPWWKGMVHAGEYVPEGTGPVGKWFRNVARKTSLASALGMEQLEIGKEIFTGRRRFGTEIPTTGQKLYWYRGKTIPTWFSMAAEVPGRLAEQVGFGIKPGRTGLGTIGRYVALAGAAYAAYQGGKYLDYLARMGTGTGPIGAATELYRGTRIGLAGALEATGIRDLSAGLEDLMPGIVTSPLSRGFRGIASIYAGAHLGGYIGSKFGARPLGGKIGLAAGALLGLTQLTDWTETPEELRARYGGEPQPVRTGAGWFLGRAPWEGGRVRYFAPDWTTRQESKFFERSLYGSEAQYWAHGTYFPTPSNLFGVLPLVDPYWLEREHYWDRPYPLTSPALEEFPIFGPILAPTVGRLLKPVKRMHVGEAAGPLQAGVSSYGPTGPVEAGASGYTEAPPLESGFSAFGNRVFIQPGLGTEGIPPEAGAAMGFPPLPIVSVPAVSPYRPGAVIGRTFRNVSQYMGFRGFLGQTISRQMIGYERPFAEQPELATSGQMTSLARRYYDIEPGGVFGLTELPRRFLSRPERWIEAVNPIRNTMPEWLPGTASPIDRDYFLNFHQGDPYTRVPLGEARLPGAGYEALHGLASGIPGYYSPLDRFLVLADVAPYSKSFRQYRGRVGREVIEGLYSPYWSRQYYQALERVEQVKEKGNYGEFPVMGEPIAVPLRVEAALGPDRFSLVPLEAGTTALDQAAGPLEAGTTATVSEGPLESGFSSLMNFIEPREAGRTHYDPADPLPARGVRFQPSRTVVRLAGIDTSPHNIASKMLTGLNQEALARMDSASSLSDRMEYGRDPLIPKYVQAVRERMFSRIKEMEGKTIWGYVDPGSMGRTAEDFEVFVPELFEAAKETGALSTEEPEVYKQIRKSHRGMLENTAAGSWRVMTRMLGEAGFIGGAGISFTAAHLAGRGLRASLTSAAIGAALGGLIGGHIEQKFLTKYDSLEHYRNYQLYSTDFAGWDKPYHNFIRPWITTGASKVHSEEWIPEWRMEQRALEEYFDKLKYAKWRMLETEARGMSRHDLANAFQEKRQQTLVGQDLRGAYAYNPDLRVALPKKEALYFDRFAEVTNPQIQEGILKSVPTYMGVIYTALWNRRKPSSVPFASEYVQQFFERETVPRDLLGADLQVAEYFSRMPMPDRDWVGYHPEVEIEDFKLKTIENEGQDYHDYGLWESQARKIEQARPFVQPLTADQMQGPMAGDLIRTALKLGIRNIGVSIQPMYTFTGNPGSVQAMIYDDHMDLVERFTSLEDQGEGAF